MSKQWYVVSTLAGSEHKVKANLERRITSMGMQDQIFRVVVPMEEAIEVKRGKKRFTKKKVFPGYVMVEMIMNDRSWYVVRNTPGVTGFVGSGMKPEPLNEEEVTRNFASDRGRKRSSPAGCRKGRDGESNCRSLFELYRDCGKRRPGKRQDDRTSFHFWSRDASRTGFF